MIKKLVTKTRDYRSDSAHERARSAALKAAGSSTHRDELLEIFSIR